jgi:hypothetical protein
MGIITNSLSKYRRKEIQARRWKPFPKVERCGWETEYGIVWANKFKINNLLDDKEEYFKRNNKFGTWEKLLGPRIKHVRVEDYQRREKKRLCRMMVNEIANEFWELMMIEIIIKNNSFKLPFNNFGYIRILPSKFPTDAKAIVPEYKTNLRLCLSRNAKAKYDMEKYNMVLTQRWREIFEDELRNNHKY